MTLPLETVLFSAFFVITGFVLAIVIGAGFVLSRRLTRRYADLDAAREQLAKRVTGHQTNQQQLQQIVVKLNAEIQQLKAVVEDAQQQQTEQSLRPVQDYERIVSLFTQGKADLSVAQAMGLSRGEADLISRLAARSSQVQ